LIKILIRIATVGLFFLVLIELFMQLLHVFNPYERNHDFKPATEGGLRILCIGDSFTFGVGAPEGESYPDHLQRMLGDSGTVINTGWPGANSAMLLKKLPQWLEQYRPDYVFVLAGRNNTYNSTDSEYLQNLYASGNHEMLMSDYDSALFYLNKILWHSALYRFVKWAAAQNPSSRYAGGRIPAHISRLGSRTIENALSEPSRSNEDNERRLQKLSAAEKAVCESDDIAESVNLVTEVLSDVRSASDLSGSHIKVFLWLKEHTTEKQLAALEATLRRRLTPEEFSLFFEIPAKLDKNERLIRDWLWHDWEQMHQICLDSGTRMVLLDYPFSSLWSAAVPFSVSNKIPFLDTGMPDWKKYEDKPTGHLTSEGYRLFAEKILTEAVRLGLIQNGNTGILERNSLLSDKKSLRDMPEKFMPWREREEIQVLAACLKKLNIPGLSLLPGGDSGDITIELIVNSSTPVLLKAYWCNQNQYYRKIGSVCFAIAESAQQVGNIEQNLSDFFQSEEMKIIEKCERLPLTTESPAHSE